MLRLFLPPNLASAAPRDAIAVRVEADLTTAPAPEIIPALALLQRWCGTPTPPQFIQLTRAQLRELIASLARQPAFFWLNRPAEPIRWIDHDLVGVSTLITPALLAPESVRKVGAVVPNRLGQDEKNPRSTEKSLRSESQGGRGQPSLPQAYDSDYTPLTIDGSEHFLALTLPSRESLSYKSALELVKANGFILEPSNRKWWLRDRHKVLNFLAAHGARLRAEGAAEFTANFEKNTAHLRHTEIISDATESGDGFTVTLGLRAGNADEVELRSAVAGNRGYLETGGKVYLIDPAQVTRVAEAQQALDGQPGTGFAGRRTYRVNSARIADAQSILEELSPGFQPPETWRARSDVLRHLSRLEPASLPAALEATLRPYQRLGSAWLWHLYRHQLGGILADEMGLGKTLQALGLLSALHAGLSGAATSRSPSNATGRSRPQEPPTVSLVICPASLLENWRREAAKFAPQLRVFVHHGEQRLTAAADFARADLIITSYGTLTRDRELFREVDFACVIADEAQHIKNRRSQNAASLRALRSHGRFLLTGTPLENSLDDLRSLFEFLLPGYLTRVPEGVRGEERAWFDQRLRAQTAPYLLRRTKQAVAPELPAKLEHVIWCELTPAQARLYRETQEKSERELFDLEAGGAGDAKLRLATLTQLLRLRQICCDPRLIKANVPVSSPEVTLPPFTDSAKLDAFRELLDEAIDDGHRILVFSQFTSLLALLRDELAAQGILYCYLDGSMSGRARQAEVDRFQASDEVPIFLLSLKAGGTGLNLTGADTVIHFDPWWNPAVEAQATDRAHRIGQSRVVTSYKLVAANTVEEKVLGLQDEKRALLAGVFEASDAVSAKLTLADLKSLLSPRR
jgi:superfamily II DNA or RNA helicase